MPIEVTSPHLEESETKAETNKKQKIQKPGVEVGKLNKRDSFSHDIKVYVHIYIYIYMYIFMYEVRNERLECTQLLSVN